MKTRVSVKYFVNDCLWIQFLLLSRPRPLKLGLIDNIGIRLTFIQFQPKIRAIQLQISGKICLTL